MAKPIGMMSAALVAAAASGFLPQLVPVQTPPAPSLQTGKAGSPVRIVAAGDTQAIKLRWRRKVAGAWLQLRNEGADPQQVTFEVVAQDRLGRQVAAARLAQPSKAIPLGPHASAIRFVGIEFLAAGSRVIPPNLPAAVFLKITSVPPSPGTPAVDHKEMSIPAAPIPGAAGIVFVSSLAAAVLVALITIVRLRLEKVNLLGPMGSPSWNLQQSWGTNVAIGGALLSTVLALSGFPEHPDLMTRVSFLQLQSLFAALVALAPPIYGLLHSDVQVAPNNVAAIESRGYIVMFLISGAIVLWGAIGQTATLFLLLQELEQGDAIDILVGSILQGLAAIFCLLLLVYGVRALYRTVIVHGAEPTKPSGRLFKTGMLLSADEAQGLPTPLPEWPLV
jgi:hypothetical protein